MFLGGIYLFIAIVSLPVISTLAWRRTPRRIGVEAENFLISRSSDVVTLPVEECLWKPSRWVAADDSGAYLPGQRLLIVWSRKLDGQHKPLRCFACGFSPETFEIWTRWLAANCGPPQPAAPVIEIVCRLLIATSAGSIAGVLIGSVLEFTAVWNDAVSLVGFIGWIDGLLVGIHWHLARGPRRQDYGEWVRKNGRAAQILMFIVPGAALARGGGLVFMATLVVVNTIIGVVASHMLYVADPEEPALSDANRSDANTLK